MIFPAEEIRTNVIWKTSCLPLLLWRNIFFQKDKINVRIYRFFFTLVIWSKESKKGWLNNKWRIFYLETAFIVTLNCAIYQRKKKTNFAKMFSISLWTHCYFSYSLITMNHPQFLFSSPALFWWYFMTLGV